MLDDRRAVSWPVRSRRTWPAVAVALCTLVGEVAATPMPAGSGPISSEARIDHVRDITRPPHIHFYTAPPPPSVRVFPGTGACYGGPYCGVPYSYAVPYEDSPSYVPYGPRHGPGWYRSGAGKRKAGGMRCTAERAASTGCIRGR